jgi:prolyl-tRNA editing enzyme YbaK/EbsC (Cys-tRNA(Pro) deacylase)
VDEHPDEHPDDRADRLVRDALEALAVPYEVVACDPELADTAAFCAHYGFSPADSANTIVVVGKVEPPVYAACVVLADSRLDVNKAVRNRFGVRKASFAPSEQTVELTGMVVGGVTAFGLPSAMPVWVDARVMERRRLILGGGSRRWKVLIDPVVFTKMPSAAVVEGLAQRVEP